jgi:hypothetical protein
MYIAFVLSKKSRAQVLSTFGSKFPDVYAHHVTYKFGISKYSGAVLVKPKKIIVVGYVLGQYIETLIVEVDGKLIRPDGKTYHLTISLDKSKGKKPVDSNLAIIQNTVIHTKPLEIDTITEMLN